MRGIWTGNCGHSATHAEQLPGVIWVSESVGVPCLPDNAHHEQTIRSDVEFHGIGLHSGAEVSMRLVPAPAGSGIVFRRTDLDNFEIPANGRNVAKVSYATSLMRGSVLISTTEHLLSALIGFGVDNVIVEIDNLELPILDGSALPYVEAFQSVGLKQQRRRREYIRILKEIEVRDGSKFIGVYPGSGYGIDYTIDFPSPIGFATFRGDLETGDYARLIAPARTFGFREDEPMLRNMGLIRGATPECAIILTRQGVQNGPLRFPDEFVRHKVLDLIGDLALAGRRIQGRVIAERAGHAMHAALVQRLLRDRSAWELAHGYDEIHEPAGLETGILSATVPAHA
jgi:UDP-3-O-[3-hydroxymyristoyl] N-acetylglucosamine deacetylase